ncbi:MAG: transglycosylase SLT domain-containing protein [Rikenellaceae bacterium]
MRRIFFSILVLIITTLFSIAFYEVLKSEKQPQTIAALKAKGVLTVAIDENQPGYFKVDSVEYGYDYAVLSEYCKTLNIRLKRVNTITATNSIKMLNSGEADIACVINTVGNVNPFRNHFIDKSIKSNFVILSHKGVNATNLSTLKELVEDKNIIVPHNFTTTQSYNTLLDSVSHMATVSYEPTSRLIEQLNSGNIDFLVCSNTDAIIGTTNHKSIDVAYSFDEQINSVMIISSSNIELEQHFRSWLEEYKQSEEYRITTSIYQNIKFLPKFIKEGSIISSREISAFDNLIREKSYNFGFDWRFISAIAYNESRFKPQSISHCGASGIMQIMPAIARHFNVSSEDITLPENNVEVALKLLTKIEKMLNLPPNISENDKLSLMLACYNGGYGHVSDARRLTRKYGDNPNDWNDVKKYLKAKSEEIYYTDSAVKSGRFIGNETLAFVDNVLRKYDEYCKNVTINDKNMLSRN